MAWECAECNVPERSEDPVTKIEVVCHHCGKPLCRQDRIQVLDDAFSDEPGPVSRDAFHCRECRRAHHPRAAALDGRQLAR
jgi:hypothetical protein